MDKIPLNIKISDICNVSKIPIYLHGNPLLDILNGIEPYIDTNTIEDFYKINCDNLHSYSYDSLFLPWSHYEPVEKYKDVFFKLFSDNDSYERHKKRLFDLRDSINSKGYLPEKFKNRQGGHITGYYLEKRDRKKFYVVSGNHRVAVMSYLGYDEVPAIFDKKEFLKERDIEGSIFAHQYGTIFSDKDVDQWPCVKNSFIPKYTALEILKAYIGE